MLIDSDGDRISASPRTCALRSYATTLCCLGSGTTLCCCSEKRVMLTKYTHTHTHIRYSGSSSLSPSFSTSLRMINRYQFRRMIVHPGILHKYTYQPRNTKHTTPVHMVELYSIHIDSGLSFLGVVIFDKTAAATAYGLVPLMRRSHITPKCERCRRRRRRISPPGTLLALVYMYTFAFDSRCLPAFVLGCCRVSLSCCYSPLRQ